MAQSQAAATTRARQLAQTFGRKGSPGGGSTIRSVQPIRRNAASISLNELRLVQLDFVYFSNNTAQGAGHTIYVDGAAAVTMAQSNAYPHDSGAFGGTVIDDPIADGIGNMDEDPKYLFPTRFLASTP
ncbi:MAG: hypothetical protein HN348_18800 [Proteobacteria bacterium]|jgi:hypothetical protein|nr:hypothetical protein [Pseudomonadota bacterium]